MAAGQDVRSRTPRRSVICEEGMVSPMQTERGAGVVQTRTTNPFFDIDLVADFRSEAYFTLKDISIHYFSLRNTNYRRDFNGELAKALSEFLALPKKVRKQLHDAFTFKQPAAKVQREFRSTDWPSSTIVNDAKVSRFFSSNDLTDVESFKTAYRRCCQTHHPDRGELAPVSLDTTLFNGTEKERGS
jgi:hypothetical protein